MLLSEFVTEVRSQIRDNGSTPVFTKTPTDEIEPFVKRAINDYSRWYPLSGKRGTLSIVVGQTDYVLPTDFIEMDEFLKEYRLFDKNLYLTASPTIVETITYYYNALHTPETVPTYDSPAVVLFASALAMRAIVSEPSKLERYISYNLNEVVNLNTENLSEVVDKIMKTADQLEKQYMVRMGAGGGGSGEGKSSGVGSGKPFMTFG